MKKLLYFLFGEYCPLNSPLVEKIIKDENLSKDLLSSISEINKGADKSFILVDGIHYKVTRTKYQIGTH